MPKNKTIPRRVNLDDDLRTLEQTDLRHALNMRFMSSSGNDSDSGENIKGTRQITVSGFPSGDVLQIGSIAHSEKNDLYVFFWARSGDHCIVRYNSITDTAKIVLKKAIFKFNKKSFVSGFAVTGNNDNDTLLYFTDNVNQPRMINVTRAELHTSGNYTDGYPNPLTEQNIRWIKYPPLFAPTIQHAEDKSVVYNNISTSVFQFRYRYRYKDGEYSAYSPASEISVSDYQIKNNSNEKAADTIYNRIEVTVKNTNQEADKIEVIAREGNDGEWLLIETVENDPDTATQIVSFLNDGTYTFVDNEEALKIADGVPLQGRTAEYIANRAMLGNTVDGFDMFAQELLDEKVTFGMRYMPNEDAQPVNITQTYDVDGGGRARITYDTSVINVRSGLVITITFQTRVVGSTQVMQTLFFTWTAGDDDTIADFFTAALAYFSNTNGFWTIYSAANSSNDLVITILDGYTYYLNKANYVYAIQGGQSYKAGAKHPHAIIYYDEAGRPFPVQKPTDNSPYSQWFSERGANEKGVAINDWRIGLTPPIGATHYQILYGGNSSVGDFLQYTTAQVEVDKNSKGKSNNQSLYIVFNNFQGSNEYHTDSYVTSRNPLIGYQYKEGDRLRIIKKPTGTTAADRAFVTEYLDFKVLGYEYYEQDTETNPVYTASSPNNFGWILTIENPEIDGWDYATVKADLDGSLGDNQWFKVMANGQGNTCLVEIYNAKGKNTKDVFYEFGQEYEIGNAGTSTRYHKGMRDQGDNITPQTIVGLRSAGGAGTAYDGLDYIEINYAGAEPDLFVGDKIKFTIVNGSTPTGTFTISRKAYITSTSRWRFYLAESLSILLTISDVSTVTLDPLFLFAAGSIEGGDVWMKSRSLITGNIDNANSPSNGRLRLLETVEDYYANDFFKSNYWSKGRPHLYNATAKQERRKATVWISEPLFPDNKTNGLSSFNLAATDKPFRDYDRSLGSIELIKRSGDAMLLFQENQISKVLVGKDTITTADGGKIITLTGAVLSEQNPYAGDYGICKNPESHAQKDGRHYFVDIKRGKVLRLSQDGLTAISDYKFSSLLDQLSRDYMSVINAENLKVYGGFDREHDEYNVTFSDVSVYSLTIDDVPVDTTPSDITTDENNIIMGLVFKRGRGRRTISNAEIFTTDAQIQTTTFEELTTNGSITLDNEKFNELQSEGTLEIAIENGANTLRGVANLEASELTIPKSNGLLADPITIAATALSGIDALTITFHEGSNSWCGHRSYKPQGYGSINYRFFGFSSGIYMHDETSTYNHFYGTQYPTQATLVFNQEPSTNKVYKALEIESNKPWGCTPATNLNATLIYVDSFDLREGFYYAPFRGATSNNTDGNVLGLGSISAINGTTITINGYKPYGIFVGDTVYSGGVSIGQISAIDGSDLTLTTIGSLVVSNFVYVVKNTLVEGDKTRGYYCTVAMEIIDDNTFTELFSASVKYANSYYSGGDLNIE